MHNDFVRRTSIKKEAYLSLPIFLQDGTNWGSHTWHTIHILSQHTSCIYTLENEGFIIIFSDVYYHFFNVA